MAIGSEDITVDLVRASLDLHMLRQRAIATNIANRSSEGFEPLKVEFEALLRSVDEKIVAGQSTDLARAALSEAVDRVKAEPLTGETVKLDEQLAALQMNLIEYEALTVALGKLGGIKRLALGGSRS